MVSGRMKVNIDQEDLTVRADLRLPGDSLIGTFAAHIPDLARYGALVDLPSLAGSIDVEGRSSGLRVNPTVSLTAEGSHLRYRNIPIDTLSAQVSLADSAFRIGAAYFKSELSVIDPLNPPLDLDSLAGRYGYEVTARGTLDDLTANARLQFFDLLYAGYTIDSARLILSASGGTISLDTGLVGTDSLEIRAFGSFSLIDSAGVLAVDFFKRTPADTTSDSPGDSNVYVGHTEGAFSFDRNGLMELTVVGREIAIDALAAFSERPVAVTGTVNFAGEFTGTAESPSGRVRVLLEQPEYQGVTLDSIVAQAVLSPALLRLDTLRVFGAGQDFFASANFELGRDTAGSIVVPENGGVSGRLLADSIALVLFEPLLPENMRVAGRASMNLIWRGTLLQPNAEGSIRMDDVYFTPRPDLDSISGLNLAVSSVDTDLRIDTAFGYYNGMPFSIAGAVQIQPWESLRTDLRFTSEGLGRLFAQGELATERLDLRLRIDTLALELFEPFVPMIDTLAGTLSCDLTITGSPEDPEITGSLLSRNLTIKPTALDSTIRNGLIKISFNRSEARIDSIYTALGNGYLLIGGILAYSGGAVTAIEIDLAARHLHLSSREYGWMKIDSSALAYTTTSDGFLLSGRIDLGESRLTREFDAELILPWTKGVETAPSDWPEMVKKTALDVQVRESKRLWVDNNLAKIRMRAGIGVIGSGARPNLSGQVTVEEGYVLYLDRKFDITEGAVLMSHPNRINPDISLKAETKVTNYQGITPTTYLIQFSAVGPMDQLQISLSSDPPLDQANIVSLLTLGVLRDQLVSGGGQGTGAGAVLTARAARLTSERLAGIASRQVESALGLVEFTVQGNLFDPQENGGPQLLASKQLSDRVKVTYLTTVGDANDQSVRVDYRLTKHVSFEGQTNRGGQAVLNIKYGLRFK